MDISSALSNCSTGQVPPRAELENVSRNFGASTKNEECCGAFPFVRRTFLLILLLLTACAPQRTPVPPGVIPRSQSVTVEEEQYGHQVLQELSTHYQVDYNDPRIERVQKIVDRLTAAAGADKEPWHVYLFKADDVKNAAATRGNHVFVWSGILNAVNSDDELATILAHEIAHVLARHTDPDPHEQVKQIMIGVGALAASIAVSSAVGGSFANDLGNLAGNVTQSIGEGVAVNPFSRELEFEADQIGLMLMAEAHYNPEAALDFWRKAQSDPDFSSGPTFFSTHPSSADRLSKLQAIMPLALDRYRGIAPSTSSPNDSADSFDINSSSAPGGTSPGLSPSRADRPVTSAPLQSTDVRDATFTQNVLEWRVVGRRAVLYSRTSKESRALGEFPHGAIISGAPVSGTGTNLGSGARRVGDWVEIHQPDFGFVPRSDLAEVYAAPDLNGRVSDGRSR